MGQQLTLGLNLKEEATFDNFYPGANAEIISQLKQALPGGKERILYLCGAQAEGTSHLLQAFCHEAHRRQYRAVYLSFAELISHHHTGKMVTPEILKELETLDVICIDDLQRIAGLAEWEEALFHLYNRIHDSGSSLIMAANTLPKSIGLHLPDLISRLSSCVIYSLRPLADEEKLAILIEKAKRRGMILSEEVGTYLLTHCPRHMNTLLAALDILDKASLSLQRKLTIPFIKEVLQI